MQNAETLSGNKESQSPPFQLGALIASNWPTPCVVNYTASLLKTEVKALPFEDHHGTPLSFHFLLLPSQHAGCCGTCFWIP